MQPDGRIIDDEFGRFFGIGMACYGKPYIAFILAEEIMFVLTHGRMMYPSWVLDGYEEVEDGYIWMHKDQTNTRIAM